MVSIKNWLIKSKASAESPKRQMEVGKCVTWRTFEVKWGFPIRSWKPVGWCLELRPEAEEMGSLWVRSSRGAVRGHFNGEEFDRKRACTSAVRVEAEAMGTLCGAWMGGPKDWAWWGRCAARLPWWGGQEDAESRRQETVVLECESRHVVKWKRTLVSV